MSRSLLFVLAVLAAGPVLAQPPQPGGASTSAAEDSDVIGELIAEVTHDDAAAAEAEPAASLRPGLTLRAATGAPVGQVAAVTEAGIVLQLQVDDRTVRKLVAPGRLALKDDAAVTDLTVRELHGLPDAP